MVEHHLSWVLREKEAAEPPQVSSIGQKLEAPHSLQLGTEASYAEIVLFDF